MRWNRAAPGNLLVLQCHYSDFHDYPPPVVDSGLGRRRGSYGELQWFAAFIFRTEFHNVLRKILDHVSTRTPVRNAQLRNRIIRFFDRHCDVVKP